MLASERPIIVRPSPCSAASALIVQLSRERSVTTTRVESSESGVSSIVASEI